jgi:hypothetical protein
MECKRESEDERICEGKKENGIAKQTRKIEIDRITCRRHNLTLRFTIR